METSGGSEQVPAGWYDDPNGGGQLRYWDGAAWTEHTHPSPAAVGEVQAATSSAPVASTQRDGPSTSEWILSVLLPIIPLLGLIWGVFLIRKHDGRETAGNVAVILSLAVILLGVLSLRL